ncbi:MAG: hypothetical protein CMK59_06200 [Proteobacteria bacterium]|nr:hypothetical protein [Pseudomonadota bacterium]
MSQQIAQYTLLRELGSGHFGTVFLAVGETPPIGRSPARRRIVAIKKLNNKSDKESNRQIRREFSLLAQVRHRCIPQVFEYIPSEGAVVMEYIHGVDLRHLLETLEHNNERIFTETAIEIGCEIADALYQVYTSPGDNGEPLLLVHRDLKPANLILTVSGDVKILDFGLARVDNTDYTAETGRQIRGTPIYMAPEQALGKGEEHRTDLYSLGLIVYELLMGKPAYCIPYDADDPVREIFQDISAGRFSFTFEELERDLPTIGPTLKRVLQKHIEDRHTNGQELLVELRRQLLRKQGAYLKEFSDFYFNQLETMEPKPTLESLEQEYPELLNQPPAQPQATNGSHQESIASRSKTVQKPRVSSKRLNNPKASNLSQDQAGRFSGNLENRIKSTVEARQKDALSGKNQKYESQSGRNVTDFSSKGEPAMAKSKRPPSNPMRSGAPKSPNEPGMLSFVPVSDEEDKVDEEGGATQFFAIPAPKSNPQNSRTGPQSTAPPPSPNLYQSGGVRPPPQSGGFPAPQNMHQQPPQRNIRSGGGIGVGGIGAGGMSGGATPVSPVAVAQTNQSSAVPIESSGRAGSQRVWFLILAVLFTFMVVVLLVLAFVIPDRQEQPVVSQKPESRQMNFYDDDIDDDDDDDEIVEINEEKKPAKKPVRKRKPKTKPKPKKAPTLNTLNVTVQGANVFVVELKCASTRVQAKVKGGAAVLKDLKPDGQCNLYFKPTPAIYGPFTPGGPLKCNISGGGSAVNCK